MFILCQLYSSCVVLFQKTRHSEKAYFAIYLSAFRAQKRSDINTKKRIQIANA